MAWRDPITNILYPSKEYAEAEGKIKTAGQIPTTERITETLAEPAREPTVISTDKLRTETIPGMLTKIEEMTKTAEGIREQIPLIEKEEKKEELTTEEKEELGIGEEEEDETTKAIKDLQDKVDTYTSEIDDLSDELATSRAAAQTENKALIDSIQNMFSARKTEMRDINKRATAAMRVFGFRMGTARYAPLIATGQIEASEAAGLRRIAELDAQEASAIAKANIAARNQDWSMLSDQIDLIEKARDETRATLEELQKSVLEKNKEIAETKRKVDIDSRIASIWDIGVTDPVDIYNLINPLKEDGTRTNDILLKEITDITKTLPETEEEWRDKVLTPDQAIDYDVPLGTTWGQVSDAGIIPPRWKPSEAETPEEKEAKRQEQWDNAMLFMERNKDQPEIAEAASPYDAAFMWLKRLNPLLSDSDLKTIIEQHGLKSRGELEKEAEEAEKYKPIIPTETTANLKTYLKKFFTDEDLEKATRGAGKAGGVMGIFVSEKEVNNYLQWLIDYVKEQRNLKYFERDIVNTLKDIIQSHKKGVGIAI